MILFHKGKPDKSGVPIWNNGAKKYYWEGKAGAYGIQDPFGAQAIVSIFGDYYSVMGLPVSTLGQILRKIGYIK